MKMKAHVTTYLWVVALLLGMGWLDTYQRPINAVRSNVYSSSCHVDLTSQSHHLPKKNEQLAHVTHAQPTPESPALYARCHQIQPREHALYKLTKENFNEPRCNSNSLHVSYRRFLPLPKWQGSRHFSKHPGEEKSMDI